MHNQTPELLETSKITRPGFRLRRLELLNWGTFHQKVHILSPEGGWTLLVGENGSGKSTAVDALRTLLVPPRLLQTSYNDASGERKRQDRSRRSYIRGAWASASQDDSTTSIPQYLRSEREFSVLLAVFANERTGNEVTLAQVLWDLGEKLDEAFAVARGDKNIRDHLCNLGESREIRKTLRSRGFEPFESFSGYAERFRGLLGIPSDGALEVFNQAIGVKEVTDVNQFIRRHMLEPSDAVDFIHKTLKPHFVELDKCWQAIQKAEKQLKDLEPIVACHLRIEEATRKKQELESLIEAAPIYYAHRHLHFRLKEAAELETKLASLQQQATDLSNAQKLDQQSKETFQAELNSGKTGLAIQALKLKRQGAEMALASKSVKYGELKQHLVTIDKINPPKNQEEFSAIRTRLSSEKPLVESNRKSTEDKMLDFQLQQKSALQDRQQIFEELQTLRVRKVLIPREYINVRDDLCKATGISQKELPFAGELMEVKAEFREWTGAIERLLRSFAISLVVPEAHYPEVTRYINQKHFGLRLVYHRVQNQISVSPSEESNDRQRVFGRLNFKTDQPLHHWVAFEVRRNYRHVCCADVGQLQRESFGLTREGLIRDGQTRHIKDDRRHVGDVSNYVLGWSAEEKIQALASKMVGVENRAQQAGLKAKQTNEQLRVLGAQLTAIDAVLAVQYFADVDFATEQQLIDQLAHEIDDLESGSEERKKLKNQVEAIQKRMDKRQEEMLSLAGEAAVSEKAQTENKAWQQKLKTLVEQHVGFDAESFAPKFSDAQEEKQLTLANIQEVENRTIDRLSRGANNQKGTISKNAEIMLPLMTTFLNHNSDESLELQPKIECGGAFAALRSQLEKEELPKHKERFKEFLSTNLIGDMAMFRTKLEQHAREIEQRVQQVNAALKMIPFTAVTYVQTVPAATRNDEIRSFRAELKNCLSGGLLPTDEDRVRIFENIRNLLDKFDKESEWTKRVTDARNWLEFGVRELTNDGDVEVNYFTASSGKSGGQKAKLAFTILASAITAQYGLAGIGDESNTFRLVVIDEAFARTDEENSDQALKLFQSLGLQLVVVSPFDAKARIVEDYVDSFHLAVNPERNDSRIKRASRAEYESEREEALAN